MLHKKIFLIFFVTLIFAGSPFSSHSNETDAEVIITEQNGKILAFSAKESHWVSENKMLSEKILGKAVNGNIAIVLTTKRILGFSVLTDEWTSEDIKLNENLEEVNIEIEGNVATMKTNYRVIGFSAHTGQWIEAP